MTKNVGSVDPHTVNVSDVEFGPEGQRIRGTLRLPQGSDQVPGVVLAHGWGMCADGDLQDYAEAISARGLATLTFDFRRLGRSEGSPRQELNPYDQIDDYRSALTWMANHERVRPTRLGVWGSSYSGGHSLVVGATDPRVGAVVAQVPTISGRLAGLRKMPSDRTAELYSQFHADRLARLNGDAPAMVQTIGTSDDRPVAYPDDASYRYMSAQAERAKHWRNETTLRSLEWARSYEPGNWIDQIGPAPLLLIAAKDDVTTPADLQLDAFNRAREPKKLVLLEGGHYSVYQEHLEQTRALAADWFATHLREESS